jgi:predicted phage terminase large subunit-like protein
VFGAWTGSHPDVIIPDDTEIPENSLTVTKRTRLYNKLRECESLILEGGLILYMGTPQTEESIYCKLEDAGYMIRRWPAELPDPSDAVRSANVCPTLIQRVRDGEKAGSPTYPQRFPFSRLLEKKAMGLAYYNLQMLLDTSLADQERYPLKLKNLIVLDTPCDMAPTNVVWGTSEKILHIEFSGFTGDSLHAPAFVEEAWQPYTDKVMYVDPKGGGADSVGYCVAGVLNGIIYILDVGGLAVGKAGGTSEAVMKKLARIAATYDVKRVIVESNWGGSKGESAYAKLLQPILGKWNGPTQVDLNHVSGQKERRILDCLEPLVNGHRIVVSEKAAKCAAFTYQFTHITRESGALGHDDEIDSVHGAVSQFISMVVLDPEKREEERRKAEALGVANEWDQWNRSRGITQPKKVDAALKQKRRRSQMKLGAGRWKKA